MSPLDALQAVGETLHGARWRSPLARQIQRPGATATGVSLRLLQMWQSGDRPTPVWLIPSLTDLLRAEATRRAAVFMALADRIEA